MDLVDVNVLVGLFRADSALHRPARAWFDRAPHDAASITILPEIAVGFVRVVTNPRVWAEATPPGQALGVLADLVSSPLVTIAEASSARWRRFTELVADRDLRGNDLHDALLAAAAIERGARLVTFDRRFARFEGLRLHLLTA